MAWALRKESLKRWVLFPLRSAADSEVLTRNASAGRGAGRDRGGVSLTASHHHRTAVGSYFELQHLIIIDPRTQKPSHLKTLNHFTLFSLRSAVDSPVIPWQDLGLVANGEACLRLHHLIPLSSEYGTCESVTARFWLWLSRKSA